MDHRAFRAAYNQRVDRMGAAEEAKILGVIFAEGDAVIMNTKTPNINLRFFDKEQAFGVMVSSGMNNPSEVLTTLKVYAACMDVIARKTEKARNKLLERLHLTDGRLTGRGSNIQAGGILYEVRPNEPETGMITFSVVKTRAGKPEEEKA